MGNGDSRCYWFWNFLQSNLSHTIINNIILNNASTLDNYGIILDPSVGSNSIIANNTIKVSNSGSLGLEQFRLEEILIQ